MSRLANIEITNNSLKDKIIISWTDYKDNYAYYLLVKKRNSMPRNMKDGNIIYKGRDNEFEDVDVKNAELYYYRLFVILNTRLYDGDIISDNKCITKAIAFQDLTDYGEHLYNTVPESVRYQDAKLKKDLPLKRFFQLLAFPFNKIETLSDAMLQQLDIDECDEEFLPYHAQWMGVEYDNKFTSDINRLILKTINEVEPYIGTKIGLEYLLQRIFKAEVQIHIKDTVDINVVNMFVDSSNAWMIEYVESINKIIRDFLALRTKYELVTNMQDNDKYDIYDKAADEYLFEDEIRDLWYEKYGIGNYYDKNPNSLFWMSTINNADSLTNDTLMTAKTSSIGSYVDDDLFDMIINKDCDEYVRQISDLYIEFINTLYTDKYKRYLNETHSDFVRIETSESCKCNYQDKYFDKLTFTSWEVYNNAYSITNSRNYLTNTSLFTTKYIIQDDLHDTLTMDSAPFIETRHAKTKEYYLTVDLIAWDDIFVEKSQDEFADYITVWNSSTYRIDISESYEDYLTVLFLEPKQYSIIEENEVLITAWTSYEKSSSYDYETYLFINTEENVLYDKDVFIEQQDYIESSSLDEEIISQTKENEELITLRTEYSEIKESKHSYDLSDTFKYTRIGFIGLSNALTNTSLYTCDSYYTNKFYEEE